MKETLASPVTDKFPDLSKFVTVVRADGTFLLGAGTLADGLIVPLFPDEDSAEEIVKSLADDPRDLQLQVTFLGDPFKAMRKAAGEGAAGFQFSSGLFTHEQCEKVFERTAGRTLFPFMTRLEEAGSQWPTVLGSALNCDDGVYLTRRGSRRFGPYDLRQWIRWDVMDRASAQLAMDQPLRSHDPGEAFWCLSHSPGDVGFIKDGTSYRFDSPAVVLFARDTALRQFMPPEGYYPVFTSAEGAREFLTQRLGGAFHAISLAESAHPRAISYQGLLAQDLGAGGALTAKPVRIDHLLHHLASVRDTFKLPPYASFVVNPVGHREDVAWGAFSDVDKDNLVLKSVAGLWKLLPGHSYAVLERVDQFDGQDTFFLSPSEFRFAEVRRSLARFDPVLDGEALLELTVIEREEVIRDFVVRGADDPLVEDVMGISIGGILDDESHLPDAKAYAPFLGRWVLNFWDTVDGERLGPCYFDTPFHMARALCHLELVDRPVRVSGKHGYSSVGFEGSGNWDLEDAGGAGMASALVRICQRMVERGYRPDDAVDMIAVANSLLKSFRISLCSNMADALVSHIPIDARPADRLMHEMGLPEEVREYLLDLIEADVDPEGDALLRHRIGDDLTAGLPARTRLFLATALLQFESFGRSPCIDYAPISVQIVKALEFEMRELAAAAVKDFGSPLDPQPASREEETLFHVLDDRRDKISLGSLTHAFKATQRAQSGILKYTGSQLAAFGVLDLTGRQTVKFILKDVLVRFRNGGAHEHAISYATCEECIDKLVGSDAQPGLILQISRWRYRHQN